MGYLSQEWISAKWQLMDTHAALPTSSASNETSKPCSDMLGEGNPEGPTKEAMEGTGPKTQAYDEPTKKLFAGSLPFDISLN